MKFSKGVSPLVATVLLIVIVVSLVAIISGWLTTFFAGTRETVTNRTDTQVGCTGASLFVESVYAAVANGTTGNVRAVVKNDGVIDDTITAAQYVNTTGHNFSTTTALPITTFSRGSIKTLLFENVSIQNCTAFSQVVVSTNCATGRYKKNPEGC
ncbi:MAG: hypothetical protein HY517_01495 [Candidatus Aenigmarchaeota archaeon]|nr:hypothetical protein [Candidatus Aenigmarchaeota archaeon]